MQTLPLPFGTAGLDRYTGEMAVRPGSMRDARNVFLRGSRIEVRAGMDATSTLPDQGGSVCTHVALVGPLKFEAAAMALGFYSVSRELHLYRLSADGSGPSHVGLLFTLDANAQTPPRLSAAEAGGKLFIGHDEPLQSRRGATFIYDPLGATALSQLTADLDGSGEAPVRFRGVIEWRQYIVGWGFASATIARPEIVRVSIPGQATKFNPEHYFIAGTAGEPVLSCREAGGFLLVRKPSNTHRIVGSSHLDFGILPLHALTGTLGHQLSIEIGGLLYDWSANGPVRYTGQVNSQDLETPLDLAGPQPADFAGLDYSSGYVQYLPDRRVLEWVMGGVSFFFDLRAQQWSYGQSTVNRFSGALFFTGSSLADEIDSAPTSRPGSVTATPSATTALIEWTNEALAGGSVDDNETAEIWLREANGVWGMVEQVPVQGGDASPQDATIDGLVVGQEYEVAMRFRRGGRYTLGYESSDPSNWPATSQDTFTTLLESPTLDSVTWSRTGGASEHATVAFTPVDTGVSHRILRDLVPVKTLDPGVDSYDDPGITGETTHSYQVVAIVGVYQSDPSNIINAYMGPSPPPSDAKWDDSTVGCGGGSPATMHDITWTDGLAADVEILEAGAVIGSVGAGVESASVCVSDQDQLRIRHKVTHASGTPDYTKDAFIVPVEPA